FRYERPSRGRYRQFTHCDVELIGAEGAAADAEVMFLAMEALDRQGLRGYEVTIGHVGILGELLTRLGLSGRLRALLLDSVEDVRRRGTAAVRERLADLDPELFDASPPAGSIAGPAGSAGGAERAPEAAAPGARDAIVALLARSGQAVLGRRSEQEVVERLLRKLRP